MAKTIESQFKMMVDIYVRQIDHLGIERLFGKYESYTLNVLMLSFSNESNKKQIEAATKSFISFLDNRRLEVEKTPLFIDKTEIIKYVNCQTSDKKYSEKTRLYYMFKLAFVIAFYQRLAERMNNKKDAIESLDDLKNLSYYQFFRGQADYEWRITPSLLRNLRMDIVLDDNYYFKLLDDCNLESKFNDLIRPTKSFSVDNKYNKYAFLQHACSYSPFIDFTKDPIIATSFALSNPNSFNDFRNVDSSIICMRFNEQKKSNMIKDRVTARDFIKNQFRMEIINSDCFIFGKPYELLKSDGTKEYICIFSIDELLNRMTPDYRVFDIPTNDRMLYQKGLFVCFYNCLCLKDFIAYELCPDLFLTKICVGKRKKRQILDGIYRKYRQYDPEHLLDPYLYFKE